MKKFIRNSGVLILFSPLIILIYLTMLFFGRKKAIEFWGPHMTSLAKQSLKLMVPKLENPKDFERFLLKMKARFRFWRPFFDIQITQETDDTLKLHIGNCPFCEVLNSVGLADLNPYVCEGDWALARENKDKWIFDREHQIGTGDSFCDHTYRRKK